MLIDSGATGAVGPRPHIGAVAVAEAPYAAGQTEAHDFFSRHYAHTLSSRGLAALRKLFGHPSVRRRHFAIDGPADLVEEDPDRRIARFTRWAVDLSATAAAAALAQARVTTDRLAALVVNTCTGYICPGVSTYLLERLGLPRGIQAYDLVGSGCGGAVPNLEVSAAVLDSAPDRAVLSVSVEICSATLQMADDLGLLVSNAIFSDGAAAVVLHSRPEGLAVVDTARRYAPEHREHIRYVYKRGQLYNQLSAALPGLAAEAAATAVRDLLAPHRLAAADITHWALHPGGAKVIDAIRDAVGLSEHQVRPSRETLAEHGNMSSATVWFVLRRILDAGVKPGEWCVILAFGAGLSAHACLLRA